MRTGATRRTTGRAALLIAAISSLTPWHSRGDEAPPAAPAAPSPSASPAPAPPSPQDADKANHRSVAFVAISRGDGVDEGLGSTIEEVLVAALSDTGRFVVVDHNQIADVLKLDAQKQALGCEDKSCVADVAGALDVQLVGSGHVGHVGTLSVITLKLLDASSAKALVRTEENVASDNALIAAAQSLAGKAVLAIWPDAQPPAAAAPAANPAPAPAQGQAVAGQPGPAPQTASPAPAPSGAPDASPATGGLNSAVVDLTSFEAPLTPYGTWMDLPGVGHVWRPNPMVVGAGFRPYATGGHWAYTEAGWAFVSDFDWGWAPFHYGHWWFDQAAGWVWLPGHVWSPAWVRWRDGGGYLGWAPMAPNGWELRGQEPAAFWCFVEPRYMVEPRVATYVLAPEQTRSVYVSAAPMRYERGAFASGRWHPGPTADRISVARGSPVTAVRYANVARPAPPAFRAFYGAQRAGGRYQPAQRASENPRYVVPARTGAPGPARYPGQRGQPRVPQKKLYPQQGQPAAGK